MEYLPKYIELYESGELERRVKQARADLESCVMCPWDCETNRLDNEKGICRSGRHARVSSYFPHHGEENVLRGWNGSGTIFFAGCNLRCVFCQNYSISQKESGREVSPEDLAGMMLSLQKQGCHNINWVTPEHVVPQILEALPMAIEGGLRLPIVYNTSGFDSLESLQLMDGIVDIYMPDFKYWNPEKAKRYLKTEKYPEAVKVAFREMHRQVGDLRTNEHGLAVRGLLVRHLLMPDGKDETQQILRFLAREISPDTFVNILEQYYPSAAVNGAKYPEINRRISSGEVRHAYNAARQHGLTRIAS